MIDKVPTDPGKEAVEPPRGMQMRWMGKAGGGMALIVAGALLDLYSSWVPGITGTGIALAAWLVVGLGSVLLCGKADWTAAAAITCWYAHWFFGRFVGPAHIVILKNNGWCEAAYVSAEVLSIAFAFFQFRRIAARYRTSTIANAGT